MEVSGQIHATAALQPEKEAKIPIKYEKNWAQFWILGEKIPDLSRKSKQDYATVPILAYLAHLILRTDFTF
jgi:hypothetical protein